MAVTPQDVAIELGVPTPTGDTLTQWSSWITRARRLIERRALLLDVDLGTIPEGDVDSVIIRAVAAHVRRPDDATRVEVSVDDGRTARTYSSGRGEVTILDAWWDELGLDLGDDGAFTIMAHGSPLPRPTSGLWP